jgi:predicted dehydrogenase
MTTHVVLVGAGNACNLWLPAVARLWWVELDAVVDLDVERARDTLARHGVSAPVRDDLDAALAELRPAIVVDLTPPGTRRAVAEAAFGAGADVIAEKPLATSVAEAAGLVRLADEHGRRLVVMQNHRYHPAVQALRGWIAHGGAGRPVLLDCELHRAVEPFERVADTPSPLLSDMAIHGFDQARNLLGLEPLRVIAHELRPDGSAFTGAAVATCTFEFDQGVRFTYRGSWAATGHETPWFGRWRIDGTRACARWEDGSPPAFERLTGHTEQGPQFDRGELEVADGPNDHPAAVPALLEGLAAGDPLPTEARDNIRSLAMVEAAIESCRSGGWVEVSRG